MLKVITTVIIKSQFDQAIDLLKKQGIPIDDIEEFIVTRNPETNGRKVIAKMKSGEERVLSDA
jgi:hypothetical protein